MALWRRLALGAPTASIERAPTRGGRQCENPRAAVLTDGRAWRPPWGLPTFSRWLHPNARGSRLAVLASILYETEDLKTAAGFEPVE